MSKRNQLSDQLENLFSDLSTPEPFGTQPTSKEPGEEGILGSFDETAPLEIPPPEPTGDDSEAPVPEVAEALAPEDDVLSSFPITPSPAAPPPDPGREPDVVQDASPQEATGGLTCYQVEPDLAQQHSDRRPAISRASTLDASASAQTIVDLIRGRYGFCYIALHVLDESGERAVMVASSSDEGRQTVNENERVTVGDDTIVGWVSAQGKPRLASDVGRSAKHPKGSVLPGTRSELAIPIGFGDKLLGVLTVHSTEQTAFDDDAVQNLQGMADVVAISLLKARQLAEAEGKARQGKIVARVTNRIQRATSIDDLLGLTLEELARAYDLAQATVCLTTTSDHESAVPAPGAIQPSAQETA